MLLRVFVVLVPCAAIVGFAACGRSRIPEPEYQAHPAHATEALCVPYPPPAAKPEAIGSQPSERAVWVDGDWIWKSLGPPTSTAGKWVWQPGAWVEAPYGATFSRAALVRLSNGALAWYPPHWHLPEHYAAAEGRDAAAGPMSSSGNPLVCPDPPRNEITGAPPPLVDAADAHVGPALQYPADAPAQAPPKVVLDAVIPSDGKHPPVLIQPPE